MTSELLNLEPLHSITEGDTEYELDLLENLMADCAELMQGMIEAFDKQDIDEFGSLAHKFKGSLLYVAGEPMASACTSLDKDARKDSKFPSKEYFEQVQQDYKAVMDALEEYKETLE